MPGAELIGKEELNEIKDVFDKGGVLYRYALPEPRSKVRQFEKEFQRKLNVKYAHAMTNGTSALLAALRALNIKPGDEVITQSFTFIATVEAIAEHGAIPVVTEVNKTLNMDPEDLESKITPATKAIIPVHMAGAPAQMDEIMSIAREHNIPVLEDAAQALGGTYRGKYLGTIGDIGIFSFDYGKPLTTGEGGMIVTNNESLFLIARAYSDHGHEQNPNLPRGKDIRHISGLNFRMMELQGAIGLAQLRKLDYIVKRTRENTKKVREGIENLPGIEFREIPDPEGEVRDSLIFFLENRKAAEKFAELFRKKGYNTKNLPDAIDWHFSGTWNHIFRDYSRYKREDLEKLWKRSADLLRRAIAVPISVKMDEDEINRLTNAIGEILKKLVRCL